jgi:hypothetical protein
MVELVEPAARQRLLLVATEAFSPLAAPLSAP